MQSLLINFYSCLSSATSLTGLTLYSPLLDLRYYYQRLTYVITTNLNKCLIISYIILLLLGSVPTTTTYCNIYRLYRYCYFIASNNILFLNSYSFTILLHYTYIIDTAVYNNTLTLTHTQYYTMARCNIIYHVSVPDTGRQSQQYYIIIIIKDYHLSHGSFSLSFIISFILVIYKSGKACISLPRDIIIKSQSHSIVS